MTRSHPVKTQATVPCELCGTPTPMLGTKRCDFCYELETRVKARPDLAWKILTRGIVQCQTT